LLGIDRSKLVTQQFSRFILPADQDIHYEYRKKLTDTGEPQEYELRIQKADGTTFWVHITATIGEDDNGVRIIRIVLLEITERKRTEDILLFLAQTSSGSKEEPFFYTLARFLAQSLDMFYVCIDRLEGDGLNATTVAVWCDGQFEDNVTYTLKDTPCGDVVGKKVCCFPASVCQYFPQDTVLQDLKAESYIGVTVFSHTGVPIGLIAVIGRNPITNRKRAEDTLNMVSARVAGELERLEVEEALKESEERFKALHNASFGGIAIHDQGVILDCNQGLSDMTGYTREELIMMDGYMLIAPESRQLILDNVKADYQKPYEAFGLRKNSEMFPMRLEARSIPYKGKIVRSVEFRDLTEQKKAEKKLKESEEDLIEAQRIAHVGNWRLDIASNEVVWSEELYKMYCFDPSLPPPPYTEHMKLFSRESWDRLSAALARTAEIGIPYELELNTIREDGTNGWMWVHGEAVFSESGKIVGLKGVAQDISERKLAEIEQEKLTEQLNQAHKMEMLGQLAGGVAHDFNNLLTVIMGYSAELSSNPALDSLSRQDAVEIFKAGERAKELTQQLLTFSRKQIVQAKVLDINELVNNLHSIFSRLIGEHIEIVSIPSGERALVKADQGQIEQVVINLVLNSRDALPEGGKIKIETSVIAATTKDIETLFRVKPGKYVLISVSDNGIGIPKDIQSKIYEPFFTTKDKGNGLGMGLSTVYGIVTQAGGSIVVDSEPGMGTTFRVLLPLTDEILPSEHEVSFDTDLHGKSEAILIVEDEEALAVLFRKMISKLGYKVTVANSGAAAIYMLEEGLRPALVITDVIMPGMNGKELADKIVQLVPDQKVMFMSGFTDNIIVPIGVRENGIPFIQKPFTLAEIGGKIKAILESL
jgi:PAS domain S-box-containing protein